MQLRYLPETRSSIQHMPPAPKQLLRRHLEKTARDWPSWDASIVKPLGNQPWQWYRLKAGSWRAVFIDCGDALQVVHVFHRGDGYDWMERR